jgi:hypothetical protein
MDRKDILSVIEDKETRDNVSDFIDSVERKVNDIKEIIEDIKGIDIIDDCFDKLDDLSKDLY